MSIPRVTPVRPSVSPLVQSTSRRVSLKTFLVILNVSQVAELEAEFEKLQGEKPQQVRFLRSQQDLKAKMEEKAALAEQGIEDEDDEGGRHGLQFGVL